MKLEKLISSLPNVVEVRGNVGLDIKGISYQSKRMKQGYLFVAIPGYSTDGHIYAKEAVEAGASAIVCERWIDELHSVPQVKVKQSRLACALLASTFFKNPSQKLNLIGVTGTNGKTTTVYLIESILRAAGKRTGILGTVESRIGDCPVYIERTTPESVDLQQILAQMVDSDVETAVMEVSSHAIDMDRIAGCHFKVVVFTNLSQDHLDFHQTLDNYFQTKLQLFNLSQDEKPLSVINFDDIYGQKIASSIPTTPVLFGIKCQTGIKAIDVKLNAEGSFFKISSPAGDFNVNLKLKGTFNVYNALAATGTCLSLGISTNKIKEGLEKVGSIPGRFETVSVGQDFIVAVDYAHTPDGLENVLKTAREISPGKVITVFGCGGDRDKTKRPLMGMVAARLSDFTIITSDNPRSEEPPSIIDQIEVGFLKESPTACYSKVINRRDAVSQAVSLAKTGDIVIIAGKGHERGQIFANKVVPFDDREVACQVLKELIGHVSPKS